MSHRGERKEPPERSGKWLLVTGWILIIGTIAAFIVLEAYWHRR